MKCGLHCGLVIDDDVDPIEFFTQMILEESGCTHPYQGCAKQEESLEYLIKSEAGFIAMSIRKRTAIMD